MLNKQIIFLFSGLISLSGCATMKESLVTGVSLGAVTGAVVGSTSNPKNINQGSLNGALIGAAVGGLSSYLIHGSLEKRDSKIRKSTLLNLEKFSVTTPGRESFQNFKLSAPDVDKECFDWEVKGNKLVQKHCVWTVRGNSYWVPLEE